MKTLSTNQIQHIEEFLISQYNIKYQDTRDEVLDHLACEIEELMNEGAYFQEAFKITFSKWHSQLKPSLWAINKTPKLVVNLLAKKDTKSLIVLFILSILTAFIINYTINDQLFILQIALMIMAIPMIIAGYVIGKRNTYSSFTTDYYKEHLKILGGFSFLVLDGMVVLYYYYAKTFAISYVNLTFLVLALFLANWSIYFAIKRNDQHNKATPTIL
ncbi:hypothetical protein HX071_11945 [Myroides marinus]|uniref:DUF1129 domain-containing protein n=1 Tax=Myroides marinus TaxID=703342 RepID=A0A1H6WXW9_9FLAO|nr:hypothetical protein [Myroides marinus]MDM1374804.1 hypothetical protein [Myroides marinus]MDM1502906.1 hypothetical protein [Myroides marinus]SEJ21761.1 hypothetical protein SAMN04488018_11723 [Myroides marinus]